RKNGSPWRRADDPHGGRPGLSLVTRPIVPAAAAAVARSPLHDARAQSPALVRSARHLLPRRTRTRASAHRVMRVLILGGYGAFGGRLAQLLAGEPALTLIIAARSRAKAVEYCERLAGGTRCIAAALDRNGDIDAALHAHRPDLVVDATGPF